MLINEVEQLVGLSKKSIRYYEENGLLKPIRNHENDYRIYQDEDIHKLKVIKFLRELGVPIRELKLLNENQMTLEECMIDRIKKIEAEEENYQKVKNMCMEIKNTNTSFHDIDITKYFCHINKLNKEGFTMREVRQSKKKKIMGAVMSSFLFSAFFIFLISTISYFQITEQEKMPTILYMIVIGILILPIISIIYNLGIRIREIKKGEEDEASKY